MVMYLNLHMALEQMRQKAENTESEIGPRVSLLQLFSTIKLSDLELNVMPLIFGIGRICILNVKLHVGVAGS